MLKTIYVGNLPFSVSDAEISSLFGQFGPVNSVKLIMDRDTGRFRGFCFVEMPSDAALTAVQNLDGQQFQGRTLRVNEAKDRAPMGGGGGGPRGGGRPPMGGRRPG
jgi:cold-inducible RNA-binding protein